MAVEANAAPTLPLPPRASASSPPTVGALLTRASAAGASRGRECSSPRSLLSRILHRGRGGGFGCRLRLPLPRYCSSGAAKEDATAKEAAAAPKVVGGRAEPPRQSPRSSLAEKKAPRAENALPASLGLGASLVLLLSKSASELSRMAELRTQMERLMMDVRADVRSCNGHPSDAEEGALSQSRGSRTGGRGNAEHRHDEAELEAELSRLQRASNDEENVTPRRDHQLEAEAESGATSGSHSVICSDSDIDDGATDQDVDLGQDDDEVAADECDSEGKKEKSPPYDGVSARELERRLHELLQSRHEARIAELESALERAQRKLRETEREACRWRDTAKLAARFTDESRLRRRPTEVTESKCGRPLGLRFQYYKSGNLYIADAYKGLMRVEPGGGQATVFATKADGVPLRFTNGIDVDQETGEVFFTDSSMNYQRSQHERVTATGDSTGRFMKYDPRTSSVTVLQSGITLLSAFVCKYINVCCFIV